MLQTVVDECEKVLLYPLNFCSSVDKYAQACLGDQKNFALGTLSGKQGTGIDIISNYCYIVCRAIQTILSANNKNYFSENLNA